MEDFTSINPDDVQEGLPAGIAAYAGAGPGLAASMTLVIYKVPNGYVINLTTPNKPIKPKTPPAPVDPEEHINVLVEGALSFFRSIRLPGEEWNGGGDQDREAMHKAIRALVEKDRRAAGPPLQRFEPGRMEQKVFTDLKELQAFLEKELNG